MRHTLVVKDVEKADEAQYSVQFTADLTSTAQLTVTGIQHRCIYSSCTIAAS